MALDYLPSESLQPVVGIHAALRSVASRDRYLAATCGSQPGDGWMPLEDLPQWIDAHMQVAAGIYGTSDRRALTAMLLLTYGWCLAAPAIASYLLEAKVPRMVGNISLRAAGGGLEVTYLRDEGAVLASDPASVLPGAVGLRDGEELRAWLREELMNSFGPVVSGLADVSPFRERTLWGMLADRWGDVCVWVGRVTSTLDTSLQEGQKLLGAPGVPWRRVPEFVYLERDGRGQPFLLRTTCCLHYKLPGGRHCSTCPLLPEDERERRMLADLSSEALA